MKMIVVMKNYTCYTKLCYENEYSSFYITFIFSINVSNENDKYHEKI